MKYGIEVGQIYIAADGSKHGHLVTDTTTFAFCDDVVTKPFDKDGFTTGDNNRIDAFKLAKVRYALVEGSPGWMTGIGGTP